MNCFNCQNLIVEGEKLCGRCGQPVQYAQQPTQVVALRYAGFWIRFVAAIVDTIIVWIGSFIVSITLAATMPVPAWLIYSIEFIIPFVYFIVMTDKYQATFGKMIVGIKVIADNGQNASLGSIILREIIGKLVSMLILMIGYVMAGFTEKKQALHDMMAGTVVVYKSK